MPGDADKPIEIEAQSVLVDESTGFNQFMGDAIVTQGSIVLSAELIEVQTSDEEVESMVAKGSQQKPAKYIQSQPNQARFIEATAIEITYDVEKGLVFLIGDANLVQGFDSFSGETLEYDINNDKVLVEGSEDGTKRVKFKIAL
ncbi:MAG: lipopolysaccharide transport periplasmic protein LptA [Gammaproteobacteria bacterium]|nr:lipopolysaccharide transport periplasmic protein LptA [Gammaproteobacteria bacterium]